MGVIDLLAVAVAMVMFVAGFRIVPGIWRNERALPGGPDEPPPTWALGLALWRGSVRGSAVAFATAGALAIGFVGLNMGSSVAQAIGLFFSVIAALLLLLAVTITFFNRPKLLVPPHLRHQPGAIGEWLGQPVRPAEPPSPRRRVARCRR